MKSVIRLLEHVSSVLGSQPTPTRGHLETLAMRLDDAAEDLKKSITLTVTPKHEFGQWRIYPACVLSQKFADMIGQKTLTPYQLAILKDLGYVIRPQVDESEFRRILSQGGDE